jgi:hypothetical protein
MTEDDGGFGGKPLAKFFKLNLLNVQPIILNQLNPVKLNA